MSDQAAGELALDDPVALSWAARIVKAALARQRRRLALAAVDGGDHAT